MFWLFINGRIWELMPQYNLFITVHSTKFYCTENRRDASKLARKVKRDRKWVNLIFEYFEGNADGRDVENWRKPRQMLILYLKFDLGYVWSSFRFGCIFSFVGYKRLYFNMREFNSFEYFWFCFFSNILGRYNISLWQISLLI